MTSCATCHRSHDVVDYDYETGREYAATYCSTRCWNAVANAPFCSTLSCCARVGSTRLVVDNGPAVGEDNAEPVYRCPRCDLRGTALRIAVVGGYLGGYRDQLSAIVGHDAWLVATRLDPKNLRGSLTQVYVVPQVGHSLVHPLNRGHALGYKLGAAAARREHATCGRVQEVGEGFAERCVAPADHELGAHHWQLLP